MSKKVAITVDPKSKTTGTVTGRPRIIRLARPDVVGFGQELSAGYAAAAADDTRETEATEWTEALLTDVADEPKRTH
jgi:hypothetical protein